MWILCFACGLFWVVATTWLPESFGAGLIGTPALGVLGPLYALVEDEGIWGRILPGLLYVGLFLLTQWLFLFPRGGLQMRLTETGRPMKRSAVAAGFAVMLLSVGLLYSLYDLVGSVGDSRVVLWVFMVIPAILWCIWSIIFWLYWCQVDYYTWSGRLIRGLIAGSVLELFVAVPVYATSKEECYCARGSYAGVIFGTTVLLWAFGPGVFILFARERQRREKLLGGADETGI
jgi:hypothetical protein